MTGIMQVPAASAATSTGVTAGEQVDLTDVAPSGAKQSFAPAAESFSMAVSEQRDSAMRMRVMDGVLKALRMRINEDHITLEAATGDQAQASEALEAEIEVVGDEKSITDAGFNPHYLLDALTAVDAPYAHFSFTLPGKPCLIMGLSSIDGDPLTDYRHVIMLMRLPS